MEDKVGSDLLFVFSEPTQSLSLGGRDFQVNKPVCSSVLRCSQSAQKCNINPSQSEANTQTVVERSVSDNGIFRVFRCMGFVKEFSLMY